MTKTQTITTYWCDGCAEQVKEKKDLLPLEKDGESLELCFKCLQYIVKLATQNNGWFVPRLKCTKCGGTGHDYSKEKKEINWYNTGSYYNIYNNYYCSCGRHG